MPVRRPFVSRDPEQDRFNRELEQTINRGVEVEVKTPPVANQQFIIRHRLGYVPKNFEILSRDKSGELYKSNPTRWDGQIAWFKYGTDSARIKIRLE